MIEPEPDAIALVQMSETEFALKSTIRYIGEIGLGPLSPQVEEQLRFVDPVTLPVSDLASVPSVFRWWVNTYGRHTPAALIHDRFIGDDAALALLGGLTEVDVDTYFRNMLKSLGFGAVRRWLLWSAVAARTRFVSGNLQKAGMIAWFVLAAIGIVWLIQALLGEQSVLFPLLLPFLASGLWGRRQAVAAVVIAYVGVPLMLLPAIAAAIGRAATWLVERVGRLVGN